MPVLRESNHSLVIDLFSTGSKSAIGNFQTHYYFFILCFFPVKHRLLFHVIINKIVFL